MRRVEVTNRYELYIWEGANQRCKKCVKLQWCFDILYKIKVFSLQRSVPVTSIVTMKSALKHALNTRVWEYSLMLSEPCENHDYITGSLLLKVDLAVALFESNSQEACLSHDTLTFRSQTLTEFAPLNPWNQPGQSEALQRSRTWHEPQLGWYLTNVSSSIRP